MYNVHYDDGLTQENDRRNSEYYNFFYNIQLKWNEALREQSYSGLDAGFCEVKTGGKRIKGSLVDYIQVAAFIEGSGISLADGTKLLNVLKDIGFRWGSNIGLPSEYRTLKSTVLAKTFYSSMPIFKETIKYPREMFGDYLKEMKAMKFAYLDIRYVVAELLCKKEFVGNFIVPTKKYSSDNFLMFHRKRLL